MRRTLAAILFAAGALVGSVAAFAQEAEQAPAQQAPAPEGQTSAFRDIMTKEYPQETLDLALQLVKVSGTSTTFDQLLPDIADQAKNNFIRANPQLQLGIIEVVDRVALQLVSRRPQLDQMLARVWASGFTHDEMEALVEFYTSETGKKFAQLQPQLLTVQMTTAQAWGRAVLADLSQRVQAELRATMAAEQQTLQGDIAGPAPQAPAGGNAAPAGEDAAPAPDLGGALAPVE